MTIVRRSIHRMAVAEDYKKHIQISSILKHALFTSPPAKRAITYYGRVCVWDDPGQQSSFIDQSPARTSDPP